ncbi:MAG: uroporphyrinogen-III C-methyltransferase [Planctomycetota bacterium]
MSQGIVYLVGAGPGDPGLLTLRGRELLAAADCVIYDRLVDPRLLDHAPPTAERVFVGKQGGANHRCTQQSAIHEILLDRARRGLQVVRLKGGDPLLFARGAEEAAVLSRAGIRYEIVPGVTAALGAAATASIPLTHRDHASAVAFITGHEDPAKSDGLDWSALARFPGTLVVYMGLSKIKEIATKLLELGKSATTPLAVIEWGATNRQRVVRTTLADALSGLEIELASPALIIIGEVAGKHDLERWFEMRPLFGQRILITRPPGQAEELQHRLELLGAQVLQQPVFTIEKPSDLATVDRFIQRLDEFDWVVFSSRNGVDSFLSRIFELGLDLRSLGRVKLAAIGPGTEAALKSYHLRADVVPSSYRAEDLASALIPHTNRKRVLLVRANRGRDVLPNELRNHGAHVESVVAYAQIDFSAPRREIIEELKQGRIDWVFFTSSNLARGFLDWITEDLKELFRSKVRLATISPITSLAVREKGYSVSAEATEYTIPGIVDAVVRAVESKFEPGFDSLPENKAGGSNHDNIRGDAKSAEGNANQQV